MGEAAEHVYRRRIAAPPLRKAMDELCARTGRTEEDVEEMPLGDAYDLAVEAYGDDLPDFWRVWSTWNDAPDDPPPMGDA